MSPSQLLFQEITSCERCPRLVQFREEIAQRKRKQYAHWDYWGKPVPGYGDPQAKLLIVGLAPAAHGGNRTGRVFTGDKSAEFLMRCLFKTGFANQPTSLSLNDGLELPMAYMTPVLKCVPPQDKPLGEELRNCFPFFHRELQHLKHLKEHSHHHHDHSHQKNDKKVAKPKKSNVPKKTTSKAKKFQKTKKVSKK